MRLWHYKLLPVLPNKMLVSQWRELVAIKRQWEKGTLKHKLVSYVMEYDKQYFCEYTRMVANEMQNRNIKFQMKIFDEIYDFCDGDITAYDFYPEHNNRYLRQCYFNLQEKYDRGIVTKDEWYKLTEKFGNLTIEVN